MTTKSVAVLIGFLADIGDAVAHRQRLHYLAWIAHAAGFIGFPPFASDGRYVTSEELDDLLEFAVAFRSVELRERLDSAGRVIEVFRLLPCAEGSGVGRSDVRQRLLRSAMTWSDSVLHVVGNALWWHARGFGDPWAVAARRGLPGRTAEYPIIIAAARRAYESVLPCGALPSALGKTRHSRATRTVSAVASAVAKPWRPLPVASGAA